MANFFEEDRLSQILKFIQQRNCVTINGLAEKLDVSTRTIRNDIKLLNEELEDVAFLEGEQGSYRLYITNPEGFEEKMKKLFKADAFFNSPQRRMAFIVQRLMRSEKPCLMDDLAFDMNIGRTTLTGDLKKVKEALKPYGLSIIGKPNTGLSIRGSELNLRFFILENIYEIVYDQYPLDKEILEIIKQVGKQYLIETMTQIYFLKAFTVMIDRFLTGHSVGKLQEKYYTLEKTQPYEIADDVAKKVEKELSICIPKEERIFITLPIVGMRTPTNIEAVAQVAISQDIKEAIQQIMKEIEYELNLKLDIEVFHEDFAYHISFMINRLKFGYHIKNPISNEVKEKYPLAYKMASIAGRVLEKLYNIKIPEDELGYLTAYFGVYMLEYSTQKQKVFKIAIICSTGRGTARLISSQLKKLMKENTEMDLFSDDIMNDELLKKYDLIFSTVKLPFQSEKPVIMISDIFDEKEILLKIEKVKYIKKVEVPAISGYVSFLVNLLEEDKFFILDSNKSYMENTNDMVDKLTKKGYLDEGFKERIKCREKKSSMVFDQFIAFPHTINYSFDKLVLALGVLPSPIIEKNEDKEKKIKLIFLMGLPESNEDDSMLLVKLYDEIIALAHNDTLVEELSKAQNYKQLVKSFIKLSSKLN